MQDFYRLISAWQPFFISVTAICATLVGLLFVAISLHPGGPGRESRASLRRLARHTFADFVQVLFMGFFFSVPEQPPSFYGMATLVIVAIGLRQVWDRIVDVWRDRGHAEHRAHLLKRLGLSLLGRVLLIVGGSEFLLLQTTPGNTQQGVFFVFAGTLVLLISAMRNAWFVLLQELV